MVFFKKLHSNQAGIDIQVQRLEQVCLVPLDSDRSHHRIVGAILQWRDVQPDFLKVAGSGQLFAKESIGCDSTSDAEGLQLTVLSCLNRFLDQTIDHRLLKTGRQIRDLGRRELSC